MDKPVKNTGKFAMPNDQGHTKISVDYEQYCKICGAQGPDYDDYPISEFGQHWYSNDNYQSDENEHWLEDVSCNGQCGYNRSNQKKSHSFTAEGKCSICGYVKSMSVKPSPTATPNVKPSITNSEEDDSIIGDILAGLLGASESQGAVFDSSVAEGAKTPETTNNDCRIALSAMTNDGRSIAVYDGISIRVDGKAIKNENIIQFYLFDMNGPIPLGEEYNGVVYSLSISEPYTEHRDAWLSSPGGLSCGFSCESYNDQTYEIILKKTSRQNQISYETIRKFSVTVNVPDEWASQRYRFITEWPAVKNEKVAKKISENLIILGSSWSIKEKEALPYLKVYDCFRNKELSVSSSRVKVYEAEGNTGSIQPSYTSGRLEHATQGKVVLHLKVDGIEQSSTMVIACSNYELSDKSIKYTVTRDSDPYSLKVTVTGINIPKDLWDFYEIGYVTYTQEHRIARGNQYIEKGEREKNTGSRIWSIEKIQKEKSFGVMFDMTESAKIRLYVRNKVNGEIVVLTPYNDESEIATHAFSYYMVEASRWVYNHKYGDGAIADYISNTHNNHPTYFDYDYHRDHVDNMSDFEKVFIDAKEATKAVADLVVDTAISTSEFIEKEDKELWDYVEITDAMIDLYKDVTDEMIIGAIDFVTLGYVGNKNISTAKEVIDSVKSIGETTINAVIYNEDIAGELIGFGVDKWKYLQQVWYITENGDALYVKSEDGKIELNMESLMNDEEYKEIHKVWVTYELLDEKIPAKFGVSDGLLNTVREQLGIELKME